jgi:hypothetical protein
MRLLDSIPAIEQGAIVAPCSLPLLPLTEDQSEIFHEK